MLRKIVGFALLAAVVPVRMRSTIARERAIPALLAAGPANTTTVDSVTAQLALTNMRGAAGFFRTTFPAAFGSVGDAALQAEDWATVIRTTRLAQLGLALQREARYLVGLREHTQGMTVDEGTTFFVDNAFLPEAVAHREALRGTQDPLKGYYTLGKLEILKLARTNRRRPARSATR